MKELTKVVRQYLIGEEYTIKKAMMRINEIGHNTVFVVNKDGKLLGSLSDGDIRNWILDGGDLNAQVVSAYNKGPKTVKADYRLTEARHLILDLEIDSVPVVNGRNEILNVLSWKDVFSGQERRAKGHLDVQVVIMAGGKGTRLDPFTRILPKPLIPIGEKPIIEMIMDKFGQYGVNKFFISVNHKARMIKSYFEEANNKYRISYIEEKMPLGTAGSLRMIKDKIKGPILVTNCDTLIEEDYTKIVRHHRAGAYDMTLVVSCRHYVIPYGVCEIENGGNLKCINEKPEYDFLVNSGMYLINKKVLGLIPAGKPFSIKDLAGKAIKTGCKVGVFPVSENDWIDIGQWQEYRNAIERLG